MNHIEFIEKNVREELLRQGFTQAVAQGGHTRQSICTSVCHRQAVKGGCLTMLCDTQSYGQRNKPAQLSVAKLSARCEMEVIRQGCSERRKPRCCNTNGSQVQKRRGNCEVSMSGTNVEVNTHPTHRCSFCGVTNIEVAGVLIAGPGVCICQKCVFLCVEMVFKHAEKTDKPTS